MTAWLFPGANPVAWTAALVGLALIGFFFPNEKNKFMLALGTSLAAMVVVGYSCMFFDKTAQGFQFILETAKSPYGSSPAIGVDGISLVFLVLTVVVMPVCILAAWEQKNHRSEFIYLLLVVELLLTLTFGTTDLFYFYVFFEGLLIPMFMLIGYWGSRERKIKAAYYFFIYTLFGSLVMLFGVIYLYFVTGSSNFAVILAAPLDEEQQIFLWFCFFAAFAVKMPLFPFHIWLPEAHVEAPTVGSMILASLLLKLGGYGFLRLSCAFLPLGTAYFSGLVAVLSLLGVIFGSLATIRQVDLKRIVAYSSVAHMNLVMLGMFSAHQQGIDGAIYMMLAHGIVSTALFFCVGMMYDRYHSRLLRYYGGLVVVMPLFASGFFIATLANMGFPGTCNFIGELLIFLGIFANNPLTLIAASTSIVLSAVYSIWLWNRIAFGTLQRTYIKRFTPITRAEASVLGLLSIATLFFGVQSAQVIEIWSHL